MQSKYSNLEDQVVPEWNLSLPLSLSSVQSQNGGREQAEKVWKTLGYLRHEAVCGQCSRH